MENLQVCHLNKLIHVPLQAKHRAIYSTVNIATNAVSTPNQARVEMAWNAGTVSRTVTRAEKRMRKSIVMCSRNADGEDFGSSRRA